MTDDHPHTATDHKETADDYRGEVLRLGPYRIAVCRDGLQWLLQRQRGAKAGGGAAFDTLGYWPTRIGLERLHRAHIGLDTGILVSFPDRIKRRGAIERDAP